MKADHDIAIIGAGLAGLSCAQALRKAGRQVAVYDKARGSGGRMATRRSDGISFDHGAQYFTARDARFAAEVASWQQQGHAAPWAGRFAAWDGESFTPSGPTLRYVGMPGMSSICRSLLGGLDFLPQQRLISLQKDENGWLMGFEEGGMRTASEVVLALPAPQAAALLPADHPAASVAASVAMSPCWATMLELENPIALAFDGLFINSGPLSWAARNSSKPGRAAQESWLLHATPAWSAAHEEDTPEQVSAALLAAYAAIAGQDIAVKSISSHRWRYALAEAPLATGCIHANGLGVAGDWLHGSRVEGAWLSGQALAARILQQS